MSQSSISGAAEAPVAHPRLSRAEFDEISRFAREHFGLDLRPGKEDLVAGRLWKPVRAGGYGSFGEYFEAARADPTGQQLSALIHALTTHHTSFHREPAHFAALSSLLTHELAGVSPLKLWSAACSTGEEPYSMAACVAAHRPDPRSWEMLATDISAPVLETARRGLYPAAAVVAVPEAWQRAAFLKGRGKAEGWVRVRPEIAARIRFETFNLTEATPSASSWHVIFCRNVLIYFDQPTQQRVIARLAAALAPGGFLMVGHSESLAGVAHQLSYVRPAIYRTGPAKGKP